MYTKFKIYLEMEKIKKDHLKKHKITLIREKQLPI